MNYELRPYQREGIDRVYEAEGHGIRKQLGVAATGLGKTVMFVSLAKERDRRAIILAHRDELVQQAADKVRAIWPEADLGIVKADRNEVEAKVVIASVQTLARPDRLQQLLDACQAPSLLGPPPGDFDLVVVDEAHHAVADTYVRVVNGLRAGEPDGPLLLGVTATPSRGDRQALNLRFDHIVFNYDIEWGIRMGYLSDLRAISVQLAALDLSDVKFSHGDYAPGLTGKLLEDADAPKHVVQAWFDHASDRKTLLFTPTVRLAELTQEEFLRRGVAAGLVHGNTPMEERRKLLADFAAGRVQVVCNCAVLTEGYDEPSIGCIVIARPTRNQGFYTQMVGRGTRRFPGKDDCLILDVVGATKDNRLVTAPTLFGLEGVPQAFDGTATFTELVDIKEQELIRQGKLEAERVELFEKFHEHVLKADVVWGTVHQAHEDLGRYIRPLGKGKPVVVLRQVEPDQDVWRADAYAAHSEQVIIAGVPLETAQAVAEDFVKNNVAVQAFVRTDARWRKDPATEAQIATARKWHMPPDEIAKHKTKGALSHALDIHITLRLERGSRGQNRF